MLYVYISSNYNFAYCLRITLEPTKDTSGTKPTMHACMAVAGGSSKTYEIYTYITAFSTLEVHWCMWP